jgi:hypothetical protein
VPEESNFSKVVVPDDLSPSRETVALVGREDTCNIPSCSGAPVSLLKVQPIEIRVIKVTRIATQAIINMSVIMKRVRIRLSRFSAGVRKAELVARLAALDAVFLLRFSIYIIYI